MHYNSSFSLYDISNEIASPWKNKDDSSALLQRIHDVSTNGPSGYPVSGSDHKPEAIVSFHIKLDPVTFPEYFFDPSSVCVAKKEERSRDQSILALYQKNYPSFYSSRIQFSTTEKLRDYRVKLVWRVTTFTIVMFKFATESRSS